MRRGPRRSCVHHGWRRRSTIVLDKLHFEVDFDAQTRPSSPIMCLEFCRVLVNLIPSRFGFYLVEIVRFLEFVMNFWWERMNWMVRELKNQLNSIWSNYPNKSILKKRKGGSLYFQSLNYPYMTQIAPIMTHRKRWPIQIVAIHIQIISKSNGGYMVCISILRGLFW